MAAARPAFQLGRLPPDRRVRDDGRRDRARRRLQDQSAAGHLQGARLARSLGDPRYATFKDQLAHKSDLQAIFRERFASNSPSTGSPASTSRTCCARRC